MLGPPPQQALEATEPSLQPKEMYLKIKTDRETQQEKKVLAAKPEDLSSIPESHTENKQTNPNSSTKLFSDKCMVAHTCAPYRERK